MITPEWWITATIFAAITQTARSALQRQMKPLLGDDGASYIRFLYALPFAWLALIAYYAPSNIPLPTPNAAFWIWVMLASTTQILFTVLLIRIFSRRTFAAGTAFSKTEVLQAAILEALLLGVIVSLVTGIAIILGVIAVIALALAKSEMTKADITWPNILKSCFSMTSAIGLASGTFLGFATVSYKGAIVALGDGELFMRALYTGAIATTIQVIAMGAWMAHFTPKQLAACFVHWKKASLAGLFGALATIGWFTAFALHAVAPVRAVGQIELIITLAVSVVWFKEKVSLIEAAAILLLTASIVMVLLGS